MARVSRATINPGASLYILENLSTAVVVLDGRLHVQAMNPAGEELFDVSAKQVLGESLVNLFPQARSYARVLRRIVRNAQPLTERDMTLALSGQRTISVDCTVTPVLGDEQQRVIVELVDLARHKRITREEYLVAQNDSARSLLRGLAHEIRNPLGGLRGAAQLLERELSDPSMLEYTQIIIREADRLHSLLTRMLGPRSLPRFEVINVHEITEHVFALLNAEITQGITLHRDYDPSIPDIHVDREWLIQATLNVAINAVQSLGDAGNITLRTRIHRHATIGSKRYRLVVSIDIVDDGPGIPKDLRETIFYPMVTGRADGTGLGLSIAQSLVNQHGGLIEFSSSDSATTFTLLLPVENRH